MFKYIVFLPYLFEGNPEDLLEKIDTIKTDLGQTLKLLETTFTDYFQVQIAEVNTQKIKRYFKISKRAEQIYFPDKLYTVLLKPKTCNITFSTLIYIKNYQEYSHYLEAIKIELPQATFRTKLLRLLEQKPPNTLLYQIFIKSFASEKIEEKETPKPVPLSHLTGEETRYTYTLFYGKDPETPLKEYCKQQNITITQYDYTQKIAENEEIKAKGLLALYKTTPEETPVFHRILAVIAISLNLLHYTLHLKKQLEQISREVSSPEYLTPDDYQRLVSWLDDILTATTAIRALGVFTDPSTEEIYQNIEKTIWIDKHLQYIYQAYQLVEKTLSANLQIINQQKTAELVEEIKKLSEEETATKTRIDVLNIAFATLSVLTLIQILKDFKILQTILPQLTLQQTLVLTTTILITAIILLIYAFFKIYNKLTTPTHTITIKPPTTLYINPKILQNKNIKHIEINQSTGKITIETTIGIIRKKKLTTTIQYIRHTLTQQNNWKIINIKIKYNKKIDKKTLQQLLQKTLQTTTDTQKLQQKIDQIVQTIMNTIKELQTK